MQEPAHPTFRFQSQLARAARHLGWLFDDQSELEAFTQHSAQACWFQQLRQHSSLTQSGRAELNRLVEQGLCLRASWPRPTDAHRCLGHRFYLSHSRNFAASTKFAALVSSQLGRHFAKLPHWPRLLESALSQIRKQHWTLLLTPATTLFQHAQAFAARANMRTASLDLALKNERLEDWLARSLAHRNLQHHIALSPQIELDLIPEHAETPLQDRASIMLADKLFVCSIRPRGTVDVLVRARLESKRFQLGSVQIHADTKQKSQRLKLKTWLDQGAVAWHLSTSARESCRMSPCSSPCKEAFQQLCFRLPATWSTIADEDWGWLAHCTRANAGPRPNESADQYRDRLWVDGYLAEAQPVHTLHHICVEQKLVGSSRVTRSETPCVCFSSVPLPLLLSNRQFQSHLSRWDWEPYGILIRRSALQKLGARPVIYGNDFDYPTLPLGDQPFFQARGKNDVWTKEREFRILGDVRLNQLAREDVRIFVHHQFEAQQFARRFPWPVLWVGTS